MIWSGIVRRRKDDRPPDDPTSPADASGTSGESPSALPDDLGISLGQPVSRRNALLNARNVGIGGLLGAVGAGYALSLDDDNGGFPPTGEFEVGSSQTITGVKRFLAEFYGDQDSAVGVYPSTEGESNAGVDLANGMTNWRIESHSSSDLRFLLAGLDEKATLSTSGDFAAQGHVRADTGLGLGHVPTRRQPFGANIDYDGSQLSAEGGDKVAAPLAVTFHGGFEAESRYPGASPTFLFGANDYITTGEATGDLHGISDLYSRLTEVHLRAPGTSINNVRGLVGEAYVDNTATGATVTGWLASISAIGPSNNAGATVFHAASLLSYSPEPDTAREQYNIYAAGPELNQFDGKIRATAGIEVTGGDTSGFRVTGVSTPNRQASASGVYAGVNDGAPGVELSNGTEAVRLDLRGSTFRILQAGAGSLVEVDADGNVTHTGGIGLFGTPAVTDQRPPSADATDLASVIALANDLKADLRAIGLKR